MKSFFKNLFLTAFFGLLSSFGFAAENYKAGQKLFVAPTAGLNLRSAPSLKAPVSRKLEYNTLVTVQVDTVVVPPAQVEVSDLYLGKLTLTGKWVQVSSNGITGYVFDGMLSRYQGMALKTHDEEAYFLSSFGKPKNKTIKKSTVIEGRKLPYETIITTYPEVLAMESTLFDGCYEVKYTLTTSFNEAYWLLHRMMLYADAAQEVKIKKLKSGAQLSFYSCT